MDRWKNTGVASGVSASTVNHDVATAKEEIRLREALDHREEKMRKKRASANDWRKARGYATRPNLEGGFVDALEPAVLVSIALCRLIVSHTPMDLS